MSVSRGNGQNGGHYYSNITQPVQIFLNFIVDPTNGNGLGVRSIKSNGYVNKVFMNSTPAATTTTSVFASGVSTIQLANMTNIVVGEVITDTTTGGNITGGTTVTAVNQALKTITLSAPTAGASAASPGDTLSFAMTPALVGNPNPLAGDILVQFKNNYNVYLFGDAGFVGPLSGTPLTSTTIHLSYVIVSLGTTTLAQWQAAGVPMGVVPAVGVSFVALATGAIGGTGAVEVPATAGSGITNVEVIGDAHLSDSTSIAQFGGMWLLSRAYASGVATAPAAGSTAAMIFDFDVSSVTIDGL